LWHAQDYICTWRIPQNSNHLCSIETQHVFCDSFSILKHVFLYLSKVRLPNASQRHIDGLGLPCRMASATSCHKYRRSLYVTHQRSGLMDSCIRMASWYGTSRTIQEALWQLQHIHHCCKMMRVTVST
jgi:hypothetical protein